MRRAELKLISITSINHDFFKKDLGQNEDIEIIVIDDTILVIDHSKNEGIRATGQSLVSNVLLETLLNRTSLLDEEQIDKGLSWKNTIKPCVIKSENKIYNIFTNRKGEQCYTDGDKIFRAPINPNSEAVEIDKISCISSKIDKVNCISSSPDSQINNDIQINIKRLKNKLAQDNLNQRLKNIEFTNKLIEVREELKAKQRLIDQEWEEEIFRYR